jgi:hypothetical protein
MTKKKEEREITEKIIRASLIKDKKLRLKELEKIQKDMPSTEQVKISLSSFKVYSEQLKYFISTIPKIAENLILSYEDVLDQKALKSLNHIKEASEYSINLVKKLVMSSEREETKVSLDDYLINYTRHLEKRLRNLETEKQLLDVNF